MAPGPFPLLLDGEPVADLADYRERGGGTAIEQARAAGPEAVIGEVLDSGLRGRGGGGFPTGRKWSGVRDGGAGRRFAVCNAAEGEPGTFKDRALLRHDPFQVIEGLAVAAHCIGAEAAYVATKRAYEQEAARLRQAIDAAVAEGWFGEIDVHLVLGPDEYLFGEEKGLLEVIEGREPLPRLFPPFQHGLFATDIQTGWEAVEGPKDGGGQPNPTLVNNVETLAAVPHIVRRGAAWYRQMGTDTSPGTIVATVTGDVVRSCVVEVELGTTLRSLLDLAGGVPDVSTEGPQMVLNGVANQIITPAMLDTPLDYEAMAAAGTGLGSAGFVVYDDTACPVELARAVSRFLYVESCGQCRSCKYGCGEITRSLEALNEGRADNRTIDVIGARLRSVTDQVRCYLATEEQLVISSMLQRFPEEFALHVEGRCSKDHERPLPAPKIVDILDGEVIWDDKQARKQPDWTYA